MEVFFLRVYDVYVNTERVDDFGGLLSYRKGNFWKFYIPVKGESGAVTFTQENIDTVFFSAASGGITDFHSVGFVLNDEDDGSRSKKIIILNLGMDMDAHEDAAKDWDIWKAKIMKPLVQENKKRFWFPNSGLEEPPFLETFYEVESFFSSKKFPRSDFDVSRNFVSSYFLQLYANFITRYPIVTRKEAKMLIRDMENVPKFLKLSWSSPAPMLFTVTTFILTHVCENLKCEKLSLLVCDDCRVAHYCDEECQEADWGRHQNICEKMKDERLNKFLIPNDLFVEMKEANKKVISFDAFFREIAYKIYETLYNSIRHELLMRKIKTGMKLCLSQVSRESKVDGIEPEKTRWNFLMLLKEERRDAKLTTLKDLRHQMKKTYGDTHCFVKELNKLKI